MKVVRVAAVVVADAGAMVSAVSAVSVVSAPNKPKNRVLVRRQKPVPEQATRVICQ